MASVASSESPVSSVSSVSSVPPASSASSVPPASSLNMEQLMDVCKQISQSEKKIADLTAENTTLKHNLSESNISNAELRHELAILKEVIEKQENDRTKAEGCIELMTHMFNELQKGYKKLSENKEHIEPANEALKSKNENLQRQKVTLVSLVEDLKSENKALASENEELKSENEKLGSENENLQYEKCEWENQAEGLKWKNETLEKAKEMLEASNRLLSSAHDNLEKEQNSLKSENLALQEAVEEFSKQKHELTEQVAQLKEEMETTKACILKRFDNLSGSFTIADFSVFKIRHDTEEKFILNTVYRDTNFHFQISRKMVETLAEKKLIEMPNNVSQFAFDKKRLKFNVNGDNIAVEAQEYKRIIQLIPIEYFDMASLQMMSYL